MSVASLELCKALYVNSGWTDTALTHFQFHDGRETVEAKPVYGYLSAKGTPAYDLGYLLRKLPASTAIRKRDGAGAAHDYSAFAPVRSGLVARDRTPEDAAAQLALKLLKLDALPKADAPV
ncbi:MAG TPA: hypothetical protein VEQ66_05220 [Propionibacteriaceae bacterium]|nr:hypothetical protein [Propionibacteriaceae bacterium]